MTHSTVNGQIGGRLILISAPSGAGKTSLVHAALAADEQLVVSISHTTRVRREGETDGLNYHFTQHADFEKMIEANQFLEHALVFGQRYGTSIKQVESQLNAGLDVILEIDWQGAEQVQKLVPDALAIFILPPSTEELERRLRGRGQDSDESMQQRLAEARLDMTKAKNYDYVIINDQFEQALLDLQHVFAASRLETQRQYGSNSQVEKLLSSGN